MPARKKRLVGLAVTLALLALNLVALNYLLAGWSSARIDLTEEGMFSISPATKRILRSLDEELTIYGYFSSRTHPKLSPLVPQIVDLLDEYRAVSRGRVVVEIIDPGEDEEAEEEAADRFGVNSTPFRLATKYESGIVNAYFALVVRYGDQYERYGFEDLIEIDPMPDGDIDVRLRNLEYDLTRAIKKTVYGFQGGAELFGQIDEPVVLTAIVSSSGLPEVLSEVPDAVRTAAEELEERGGDKFVYEEIDPASSPEAQQIVDTRFRLPPMSLGFFGDESFYLYAILQVGDRMEQILLTGESVTAAGIREAIESSMKRHTPGFLKTVGVATSGEPQIPPELRMQMQMPPEPPPEFQEVKRYLEQEYLVTDVKLGDPGGVPTDVDVLLVLKPKNLGENEIFALDQYLMRGGRVVLCTGQYEADFSRNGLNVAPVSSGLDDWLKGHGLSIDSTLVLDDRNQALPIPEVRYTSLGAIRTLNLAPYPYLVQVREDGFLDRDITATLDTVGIYWGSPLSVDENATGDLEVIPILQSSPVSWTSDDLSLVSFVDYEVPVEGTEPHLLSVAMSGRFKSYFADAPGGVEDGEPAEGEQTPDLATSLPLQESTETRLVVIGNAEFLSDFVARSISGLDGGFFVENLRFVENLIDWVSLDNDMIGIRSRGLVSRLVDRVEPGAQFAFETANYVIPIALLFAAGAYFHWKRRNAVPMSGAASTIGPSGSPSHKEA